MYMGTSAHEKALCVFGESVMTIHNRTVHVDCSHVHVHRDAQTTEKSVFYGFLSLVSDYGKKLIYGRI